MDSQITALYCLGNDLLRAMNHRDAPQCQTSKAEVINCAFVAALYFESECCFGWPVLHEQDYMPSRLEKSSFNRRVNRIKPLSLTLFAVPGEQFKLLDDESVYVIDSFPIAACDNYRIRLSRRFCGEDYRGYVASKKR